MVRRTAMLMAAGALASTAMMLSSPALSPPAQAEPTAIMIAKCLDAGQPVEERPATVVYNCDDTGILRNMTWTSWGADGANGTGTDYSIECKPNCAEGPMLVNPVVVHAWNPKAPEGTGCPAGVQFYSDITIAYPEGVPPWIKPGTTWDVGTDFVTVDGVPAVHFSNVKPYSCTSLAS